MSDNMTKEEIIARLKVLKAKQRQLNGLQMAIKIAMNGLYGAMANENFRFYKLVMAEAITLSGQLSVKWAGSDVNKWLNRYLGTKDYPYLIYTDTDSIYLNLESVVNKISKGKHLSREKTEKFLDVFCSKEISPVIGESYDRLRSATSAYENKMNMKREKICGSAIFVAKKRYCLLVYNSEGVHYETPKVSVTGIEAVRSNTPDICKEALIDSFRIMLTSGEEATQEYIEEFKEKFENAPASEVARITGVKGIEDYKNEETGHYKKGCPIHVRASYIHNKLVSDLGLDKKMQKIISGDKIKYLYLKKPNPTHEDVVAFVGDKMPEEFSLDKYVDYKLQFQKVFISPLEKVMTACGWNIEKQDTLEDFFG